MFRSIEPQVAGFLGEKTEIDTSIHPPIVHRLDYQFDGWPKDDILETFPCYIVTERLKKEIEDQALTGVIFDDIITSMSKMFAKHNADKLLPNFYWLKAIGVPREDDFAIGEDYRLLISDRVFELLKEFNCSNGHFQLDK